MCGIQIYILFFGCLFLGSGSHVGPYTPGHGDYENFKKELKNRHVFTPPKVSSACPSLDRKAWIRIVQGGVKLHFSRIFLWILERVSSN